MSSEKELAEPIMEEEGTATENENGADVSALRDNIARKGRNAYYFAHDKTPTGPKWDGKPEPKLLGTTTAASSNKRMERAASASFDMNQSSITKYSFSDGTKSVKLYIDYKVIVGEEVMKKVEEEEEAAKKAEEEAAKKVEEAAKEAAAEGEAAPAETPSETPAPAETPTETPAPTETPPPVLTQDNIRLDYTEQSLSLAIDVPEAASQSLIFTKLAGSITSATFKLKPDIKMLVLILKKAQPGDEWKTINDQGNPDVQVV